MLNKVVCFLLGHKIYLKNGRDGFVCKRCGRTQLKG